MKLISFTMLILACLFMSACQYLPSSLGNIAIVDAKNPVSPVDGSKPVASASLYKFQGGDYGVSVWSDGTLPLLKR